MSSTAMVNPCDVRRVRQRTVVPSRFIELGRAFHRAANKVEKEWDSLSKPEKQELLQLAYHLNERNESPSGPLLKLWAAAYILFIKVNGQERELLFCLDALDKLTRILSKVVEREEDQIASSWSFKYLDSAIQETFSDDESQYPPDLLEYSNKIAQQIADEDPNLKINQKDVAKKIANSLASYTD